jgi:ribosomal protein S5
VLSQAAAFGYAAWLTGLSHGLVGCVYGRADEVVTRAVRTALRTPARHLFTVALGYPA